MLNFVFFPISFGVFSVQGSCDGSTGALCARLSFLLITFGVFAFYESFVSKVWGDTFGRVRKFPWEIKWGNLRKTTLENVKN